MAAFMKDPDVPVDEAVHLFEKVFGVKPTVAVAAPGRANLIGEHTDYNDGFVLPFALSKCTIIVARPVEGHTITIASTLYDGTVSYSADSAEGIVKGSPSWANYVKGVTQQFLLRGLKVGGFQAAISTAVPLGGGVSSSAAIEVATATLLAELNGHAVDKVTRAVICQTSSNKFVGVPCGIMDQLISSTGEKDHLMLIDCRSLTLDKIPFISDEVCVVVANTNVKHELEGSEYSTRRKQCEIAAEAVQAKFPEKKIVKLRDCTLDMLDESIDMIPVSEDIPTIIKRAEHAIREESRTLGVVKRLKEDGLTHETCVAVGRAINACHFSLQIKYEVSCVELDVLASIARSVKGVYGSRMMGGGFGGCTVTLLKKEAVKDLCDKIDAEYEARTGLKASYFVTTPGEGARVIKL